MENAAQYSEDRGNVSCNEKQVKIPGNFPGIPKLDLTHKEPVITVRRAEKLEDPHMKITLEDIQRVLTPRSEKRRIKQRNVEEQRHTSYHSDSNVGEHDSRLNEHQNERGTGNDEILPMILPQDSSSPKPVSRKGSAHFNTTRMITELHEVFEINQQNEENVLNLKAVQEARRHSVFSPRIERTRHERCQSLPNMDIKDLPQRYFVKLDPDRASVKPVNLEGKNYSSRRCQTLSDNLRRLDETGIILSDEDRKRMIGEWVRETSQMEYQDHHLK